MNNNTFALRSLPRHLVMAGLLSLGFSTMTIAEELTQEDIEIRNELKLSPVVVTATRTEQNSFDLPVSIDAVDGDVMREGQLKVNLSETSARVPGVVINNRNNPAQDLGIQIRGFGSRSAFGVRGVRLYADGIPMTMPDGQGQTGTFNIDTAKSVEYLRGPFSALYGNSSGGVVQILTQDGPADPTLTGDIVFGSYGTHRESITYGGDNEGFNYIVNANTFRSDGYRDQAEMRRDTLHAKLKFELNEDTDLTIVGTALDQPDNEDPQGLTEAQVREDRKQVSKGTSDFNTRVSKSHEQIGAIIDHKLTEQDTLRFMTYYGQRENEQYQSVPISAQALASSGGGVAVIDRDFGGVDMRWTHAGSMNNLPYSFTIGTNYDRMEDDRKGYENFVGSTLGVKGKLRRDEINKVNNFDQYLQGSIDLHPRWSLSVGARHSRVEFETNDKYIVGTNLDDSGSVTFKETTPVIGVVFKATDTLNFYANAGESFETPTFVEMAYKSTGAGLNLDLNPATSRQYEAGVKWMINASTILNASIYKIDTDDEIVVQQSAGGRTVFQNADSSERKGFELSLDSRFSHGVSTYLAYSYLDAEFTSEFSSCTPYFVTGGAFCRNDTQKELIAKGTDIPGTYKHTLYGEIAWRHQPTGFSTAIEGRAFSKTYVAFKPEYGEADGYAIASWRAGFNHKTGDWRFSEFVRVENIFDKEYIGSVRVGDLNGNYYEPAPTRNWLLGLNASYQF